MQLKKLPLFCLLTLLALTSGPSAEPATSRSMPAVGLSRLPAPVVQRQLDQLFYRWESYDLDLPEIHRQVRKNRQVSLHLGGRVFDLELHPSDVRGPGFRSILQTAQGVVVEPLRPVATYKGHVIGDPQSSVRLLVRPGVLEGYIRTQEAWTFIQPLSRFTRGRTAGVVVFDDADVRPEARSRCGVGEIASRIQELQSTADRSITGVAEESWSNPVRQIEVAFEADYEYYQIHTYNTDFHIQSLINQVNGIYEPELSLNILIAYNQVWTMEPDPYSATTIFPLLDEFRVRWENLMGHVQRDHAFLLSGKNIGVGLTYGTICLPSKSYSAMGLDSASAAIFELKLVAHELGHAGDAIHDDQYFGYPCNGYGQLMCSVIQQWGSNTFSPQSKNSIASYLSQHNSCVRPLEYTLFSTQVPDSYLDARPGYEVGTVFTSSADGLIDGFRFFKAPNETGSHTLRLWNDYGGLLTSVTLSSETPSGWQEIYLPFSYRIYAGTRYRVTVNTNTWQAKTYCGISSPITNGPLTALGGYWGTPTGAFPQNSSCSNFFVDVLFRRD